MEEVEDNHDSEHKIPERKPGENTRSTGGDADVNELHWPPQRTDRDAGDWGRQVSNHTTRRVRA